MPAVRTDLTIEQGTTWSHGWHVTYNGTAIDATWTAAAQIRSGANTRSGVLHTFDVSVSGAGDVVLTLDYADSERWRFDVGYYDVEVTSPDGIRLRVAEGRVTVKREVTNV